MKNFVIIGVAGYIAERHVRAIQETGNNLVAAVDPFDSVGFLDRYFKECRFFTSLPELQRWMDSTEVKVDYITICSPNYLHNMHIRFALRNDIDVICEKPLVVDPTELGLLQGLAHARGKKVWNILQLRYDEEIIKLKNSITPGKHKVDVSYITARGAWYHKSWKGSTEKSGGLVMNIGIHLIDMLVWVFGEVKNVKIYTEKHDRVSGFFELENADVTWFLSIDPKDIPDGEPVHRSIIVDGKSVEFGKNHTNLHTVSYEKILAGEGFQIEDVMYPINIVDRIKYVENTEPYGEDERMGHVSK